MGYRADFVALDALGNPVLVAEVKAMRGTTSAWAARLRRNLAAHGMVASAPYFLLATPDKFYVWEQKQPGLAEVLPTHTADARDLLGPYLSRAGLSEKLVSGKSFELIVGAWLRDTLERSELAENVRRANPWLADILEDVKGGRIAHELST